MAHKEFLLKLYLLPVPLNPPHPVIREKQAFLCVWFNLSENYLQQAFESWKNSYKQIKAFRLKRKKPSKARVLLEAMHLKHITKNGYFFGVGNANEFVLITFMMLI